MVASRLATRTSTELHFVGLKNYSTILTSGPMLQTFGRTFLLLVVVLPIQLILGYLVAKVFYRVRDVPGAGLIRTLCLLPVMLPEIVVGLLFGYMLNPRVGVMNYYLGQLGLPKPDWFGSTSFAMTAATRSCTAVDTGSEGGLALEVKGGCRRNRRREACG